MQNELVKAQAKLRAIDSLSNSLQKIDNIKLKNDGLYLIHKIIEASDFDSNLAREVQAFSIEANKDLFITI